MSLKFVTTASALAAGAAIAFAPGVSAQEPSDCVDTGPATVCNTNLPPASPGDVAGRGPAGANQQNGAGRDKGAFFRSTTNDVFYTVCVKFPTKRRLCAPKQEAKAGTLYVNKITSNIPGQHKVTWFVEGKRVGLFAFNVKG